MNRRVLAVIVTVASILVPAAVSSPAAAARCVSGQDVRKQVSTFVHSLHDDVASAARTAARGAFVESVRAARGVKADTDEERRGLGKEISALARQLKDATDQVERKALIAEIHALQDQKKADHIKHGDVESIRSDLGKLKRAIVAKTDTPAEGREVAAFVHALMAQFNC